MNINKLTGGKPQITYTDVTRTRWDGEPHLSPSCSVPDPNPPDPYIFGLPDPDLLVRGMDPDPSIIKQK
jgi:hypothetical protein